MCACACACVRACVCVCVSACACVRACVCVCAPEALRGRDVGHGDVPGVADVAGDNNIVINIINININNLKPNI